ncbi:hypothetical protein AB0P21_13510 [Kribbella sp. NPDC056861]|uniref:hypothetical protein n=1 Tax=Kribbella sp. NPDC056861 TaxID=3154857 RepID=UPI0034265DCE
MRRVTPGVAVVALAGLAALTGCGNDAGAATTPAATTAPTTTPAAVAIPTNGLAALAVVPGGFLKGAPGDPTQLTGPFTRQTFVDTLSAVPAEDLALLLNAGCKDGYQTFRLSPDRRKRVTVQLFKTASKPKAHDLQQGFWNQTEHAKPFAVPGLPGALTDARTAITGATDKVVAVAEASITVGTMVAEVTVTQTGSLEKPPVPDLKLATAVIRLQQARLTTKSG